MKRFPFSPARFIRISVSALLLGLSADGIISAQEKEPPARDVFFKKTEDAVKRKIDAILSDADFTADRRIRENIENGIRARIARAEAAGTFAQQHFAGKTVVPIFFNCPDDSADEEELNAFLSHAPDLKLVGPVYLKASPEHVLPLPDEAPTADMLNEALMKGIELHADLIVNFTGLPLLRAEKNKLIFWKWGENDPRLILMDVPDSLLLKESLFPCPIAAAVIPGPFPEEEKKEQADKQEQEAESSDPQFLLLSGENIKRMIQEKKVILPAG